MKSDKMVVRLKDKTLLKGTARDFSPKSRFFKMRLLNGEVMPVSIEQSKAIFFVKTFNGNKNHRYSYTDVIPWGGHKVEVEFFDGEVIIGYTPYYNYGRHGFFLTPADLKGNNKEVFVVISSTRQINYI